MDRHRRITASLAWAFFAGALTFGIGVGVGLSQRPARPSVVGKGDETLYPKRNNALSPMAIVGAGAVVALFASVAGGVWRYTRPE